MKKLLRLGLIIAGTAALSLTMANARCGDNPPDKVRAPLKKCESGKCNAGKCGKAGMKDAMKKEMNATSPSKEMNATKPSTDTDKKKMPVKGKCGVGKCG
ncbi:hypothetical protein [Sulfurovum sp.]|uniref:hypothetical protein n=1 Tax=Sulfurovum sp. TaxID=1969726 RepID=UPI0025F585B7|nr:hypothetical protein [Sulfurovum sp.]